MSHFLELEFDLIAGHRLPGHPKCGNIHGHNYVLGLVLARRDGDFDDKGMIVDFDLVRAQVNERILDLWDHALLLHKEDPLAFSAAREAPRLGEKSRYGLSKVVELGAPPTAEVLAATFFNLCAIHTLGVGALKDLEIMGTWVQETRGCKAHYFPQTDILDPV